MKTGIFTHVMAALLLLAGCSTATSRARLKPADVVVALIEFHGAVAEQFDAGGMELEHYNVVNQWIGSEIRILRANPTQWEGQGRLGWFRVKMICLPFENLNAITHRIDALLQ